MIHDTFPLGVLGPFEAQFICISLLEPYHFLNFFLSNGLSGLVLNICSFPLD